jgi:uncharacterized protein YuzB (UPF0349 family)
LHKKKTHFFPLIQGAVVSGFARPELVLQNTYDFVRTQPQFGPRTEISR